MLAATPKCPLCIAGYIAALTSIGVSFQTASALRLGWLALSATVLILLSVQLAAKLIAKFCAG
jgi:hypothetical protein